MKQFKITLRYYQQLAFLIKEGYRVTISINYIIGLTLGLGFKPNILGVKALKHYYTFTPVYFTIL